MNCFPKTILLLGPICFLFFLHPSASQSSPAGLTKWVKDKDWRCKPCSAARWRECQPFEVPDGPGVKTTRTKMTPVIRNCICIPNFQKEVSSLYCDRNDPELLNTTKPWLDKECCNYPTCKNSPPFDDMRDPQKGVPCWVDNDLVIVLDSSHTFQATAAVGIPNDQWDHARKFVQKFADEWLQPGNQKYVRLAVMAFDVDSHLELDFDFSKTAIKERVVRRISNIPYYGGRTHTRESLRKATKLFLETGRKGVRWTMLQVTDAVWTHPYGISASHPKEEIKDAQDAGIRLFGIGAGTHLHAENLKLLSDNKQDHATLIKGYENTPNAISELTRKICYEGV